MSGSSARDAVPGEGRDYLVVSMYGLHGRTLTPAAAPAAAGVTAQVKWKAGYTYAVGS